MAKKPIRRKIKRKNPCPIWACGMNPSTKLTRFRKNPNSQLDDLKRQYLIAVFEGRFATAEYLKSIIEEMGGWVLKSKVYNSTFLDKISGEIFE